MRWIENVNIILADIATEIKQKLKINNFFKCLRLWKWDERKQKYGIYSTYSHSQY